MGDIIQVEQVFMVLAANGGADGSLTVADTSGFYTGCHGFVGSSGQPTKRIIIVRVDDTAKKVYARIVADDNEQQQAMQVYGGTSNFSAYTTAQTAYIAQEAGLARVEYQFSRVPKRNI